MTKETERDWLDVVTDLDDGKVSAQITQQLRKLVTAVMTTGRAGDLTLKLKLKRSGEMVVAEADVKAKLPQPATLQTAFYATENGDLQRNDPRQQPLRHVPVNPPAPLRAMPNQPVKEE